MCWRFLKSTGNLDYIRRAKLMKTKGETAALFCLLTSVLLSMTVIIANTTKAQPDSARTMYAELLINQRLDELYPEAESIKGYTEHLRLTAGEKKIVRLGIPQIPGDLSSTPLYDKDVIISAGKNDCINYEKSDEEESVVITAIRPGSSVLYVRSAKYNYSYKIFIYVNE